MSPGRIAENLAAVHVFMMELYDIGDRERVPLGRFSGGSR